MKTLAYFKEIVVPAWVYAQLGFVSNEERLNVKKL